MQAAASKPREFKGRHMLAIMIGFFSVVIGVNLLMAYLANSTWSGLVVANGYVASQSFNKDEARGKAQEAMGWKVEFAHAADGVTIGFADKTAKALAGLTVTGELRRPTTDRDDRRLAFHETQAGAYTAAAPLAPGVWEIDVTANGDGAAAYVKTFRFVVK